MAIVVTAGVVSFGHANPESTAQPTLGASILQNRRQSAACITSTQTGSIGIKDGEYLPAYSTRSVPRSDPGGHKYVGYHCWRETNADLHSLWWESDAANAMNDFMICRYSVGASTAKEASLSLGGGTINFINKDGSGTGGGLMMAVYEGSAPATVFKGNEIKFGTSLFQKKWTKQPTDTKLRIEPLSVPLRFRSAVKEFSVVLVGVDPWIDTRITIQIDSLKVSSKLSSVKIPVRKKGR